MKASLLLNEKDHETSRKRRALHTAVGNDIGTMLLKTRIRAQKFLNEMNGWSVHPDPSDQHRQNVMNQTMTALHLLTTESDADLPKEGSPVPASLFASMEDRLASEHRERMARWSATLEEQYRRTAVLAGGDGFRKFAQAPAEVIERALQDRQRLLERTQLSRSGARPPDASLEGAEEAAPGAPVDANSDEAIILAAEQARVQRKKGDKVVCREVFDDTDFYEQLLHEFIRSRGGDLEGPSSGKKWTDLQQLRSKLKVISSDRASKGRKVRYTIYPKMVNVAAPRASLVPPDHLACNIMNDSERENLYRSIFR